MKRFLFGFSIILLSAVVLASPSVLAQEAISPARLMAISAKCDDLHFTLQKLQRSDAVSRTNMGREYENILDQLKALSDRLENNKINNAQFDALREELKSTIDAFRAAYIEYDNTLTSLRQIDCKTKPADFDLALQRTHGLRATIHAQTVTAEGIIARYREEVQKFRGELERLNKAAQAVKP